MEEEITVMFENLRQQTMESIKLDIETIINIHKGEKHDSKRKSVGADTATK